MKASKLHNTLLSLICLLAMAPLLLTSCYQETAIPVAANFSTSFINGDQSVPVLIGINNESEGADTFLWSFPGGQPSSSTDENPGSVIYNEAGSYTIGLTVSNVDGSTATSEKSITIVDGITVSFTAEILNSNFPPVEVQLTNTTEGEGLTYQWTFEGGTPATSTDKDPDNVVFETPGTHLITLEASNGFETFMETTTITVAPDIEAVFDWEVDFFDDDYQAPVTITMTNSSISATEYSWTFPSGTPATSTEETPTVTFNTPGTYTIILEAANDKRTDIATRSITILPDTNIKSFTNVELGINSAHTANTKGAFFSTTLRKVFQASNNVSSVILSN